MNKKILVVVGVLILALIAVSLIFLPKTIIEKEDKLYRFSSEKEIYDSFLNTHNLPLTMQGMEVRGMVAKAEAGGALGDDGGASYSETNIQVEGVDEADIIKIDGEYIYLIRNIYDYQTYKEKTELIIINSYPDSEIVSKTTFENFRARELFIHEEKVVLFGQTSIPYSYLKGYQEEGEIYQTTEAVDVGDASPERTSMILPPYIPSMELSSVKIIDTEDKQNPQILKSFDFEGSYLTSRKINENVYFILNSYPRFNFLNNPTCYDIAPLYRETTTDINSELEVIVPCDKIGYVSPVQAQSFLTIIGFSLDSLNLEKEVIVGSGQNIYASTKNLYVAQTTWPRFDNIGEPLEEYKQETVISKFSLDSGKIVYQTTGRVEGYVLNQFSMDEHNGYFRIATTSQPFWGGSILFEPTIIEPMIVEEYLEEDVKVLEN